MNWLIWKQLNSDFYSCNNPQFGSEVSLETCHENAMLYLVRLSL